MAEHDDWVLAAKRAGITCHQITERPDEFRRAFGLSPEGATLVRPDGYIAWRATGLSEAVTLTEVLSRVACSTSPAFPPARPAPPR